jgi:hypothetical protein
METAIANPLVINNSAAREESIGPASMSQADPEPRQQVSMTIADNKIETRSPVKEAMSPSSQENRGQRSRTGMRYCKELI